VDEDPPDPTAAELIDAFIHPPRLITIAQRVELTDGRVRVLSHLELWPWRTVISGVYASARRADVPQEARARHQWPFVAVDGTDWFSAWQLDDDVETVYDRTGGGGGGSGGDLWATFHVEFVPNVPSRAKRLTIHMPDGDPIQVSV
jgi:hypothetical protein